MSKGHFMSNGPISYLSSSALRTLSSSWRFLSSSTATTSLLKTSLAILRSLSWSILRVSWNARSCSFLISLSFSALQKKLAFLKSNLIETDLEIEKNKKNYLSSFLSLSSSSCFFSSSLTLFLDVASFLFLALNTSGFLKWSNYHQRIANAALRRRQGLPHEIFVCIYVRWRVHIWLWDNTLQGPWRKVWD